MQLPVMPPVAPMLARLARELPMGILYEPKWDGFRCLVFRDGEEVELQSRNGRPLARYFPELLDALRRLAADEVVLDGELLVPAAGGFDFDALLARLHPARSRVDRLSRETPAVFVAFDLLALGGESFLERPFAERRAGLETLLADVDPPLLLTPLTDDPAHAEEWLRARAGIDGVMAKDPAAPYRPGERALVKVKEEHTADCVVAGFRLFEERPLPSSLLLGVHDELGDLRHVGVASSFSEPVRVQLLEELRPRIVSLAGHPWEHGFLLGGSAMGRMKGAAARWTPELGLDWFPVAPDVVCEVAYDHLDGDRFRHPARFRRFRPDRDPRSCTFEQFGTPTPAPSRMS